MIAAPLCLSAISAAQDSVTVDDLKTYEQRLEEERQKLAAIEDAKKSARTDMTAVNEQLLAAAQESLRREEQAAEIEKRLVILQIQERDAQKQLMQDREDLKEILAALVAASRKQPPALVTHPDEASSAIQAAIVMRDVADRLEERSEDLAEKIREYADLTEKVQKEKDKLSDAEDRLSEKEQEIQKLAAIKRAAYEDISEESEEIQKRIDRLVEETENIRTFLTAIEETAPPPPSRKPPGLSTTTGSGPDDPIAVAVLTKLGLPAVGEIAQKYGDTLPSGRKAEGIMVRTRASAQVVAPADGEIVFSGPFRSYGLMLILRTGDGYHIVLSGLENIYGAKGQKVLAGEPVGQMSNREDVPTELYMELHKDGSSHDPAKWMSRSTG